MFLLKYLILILILIPNLYAKEYKILFISSYNSSFPSIDEQLRGIKSVLSCTKYQLDIEYMDTKRFSPATIEPLFYELLKTKKNILKEYNAFLIGDDNALHFVEKYQNEFFKDRPILFLAINDESYAIQMAKNNFITGIIEKSSISDTLHLIKKLHPNEKIIVIKDSTPTSKAIMKSFTKDDLNQIEIISLENYSYDELFSKLKLLKKNQPLLYISAMSDKNGDRKEFFDSINFIKEANDIPIYHLYEHGVGHGMIGGKVVLFSKQGKLASYILEDVLNGKDISKVDTVLESKNEYLFDYNELKKFNLEDKIPENSKILNKPKTFFELSMNEVLKYLLFIFAVLIIWILYLLRKRTLDSIELRNNISQLKMAQSVAKIGFWGLDFTKNTLHWSDEIYTIFELKKENFTPSYENFLNVIHPEDRERVKKAYENSLSTKQPYEITHRLIMSDNKIKYVLEKCETKFDTNNKPLISIGTVYDITKQKEYENQLIKTTNEQLSLLLLFDKGELVLFKWNNDDKWSIDYVSSNVQNLLGYNKEEFLNSKVVYANCIHQDDLPNVTEEVIKGRDSKDSFFRHKPYRVITKNGDIKWVLDYTVLVKDKDNITTHFLGYIMDISDQINAQHKLAQINKNLEKEAQKRLEELRQKDQLIQQQNKLAEMGEMIGAIAHQWRQPLNELSISIQNLEYDYEDGLLNKNFLEKYIEKNTHTINFMSKTIDNFRNFFREDKEKVHFDIKEEIKDIITLLSAQFEHHNIMIDLKGNTFKVYGHQTEFKQVILNILNNAKDTFIEKEIKTPLILIELNNKNDTISIADNGGGVAKNIINRIFEPYFTTKEQGKGTGIGLYLSKAIINNMDGLLTVSNTKYGANFIIDFSNQKGTKI